MNSLLAFSFKAGYKEVEGPELRLELDKNKPVAVEGL